MKNKVEETLSGLKDFQRKTVDYAMEQFKKGRTRFLIADEVGLGKTIIAKGIIARLFEKAVLQNRVKRFNVVYVCSNQAIAKANIGKLNFTHDRSAISVSSDDDRITSLAYDNSPDDDTRVFTIRAFTPSTSFDDKTHAGRKDERVLLYRLLYEYAELNADKNSLKWILKGNNQISEESWDNAIRDAERGLGRPIRTKVSAEFRKKLEITVCRSELSKSFNAAGISANEVKYWTLLRNLCRLSVRKNNTLNFDFGKELISHLRLTLSQACIAFLHADIFILDEFQRYKKLIEDDPENSSPAAEMTRAIFSMQDTKVLMLSATPFKAYTNDYDELNGEVHHKEFDTVLKFLNPNLKQKQWNEFNENRSELFSILRHSADVENDREKAIRIRKDLERFYRSCMVRTERLSVSKDRDSLIKSMVTKYLEPEDGDLEDFIALDKLTIYLNENHKKQLPIPIEYVKSSPFALSFLEGYQHRKRLLEVINDDDELRAMLKKIRHAWVNMKEISKYRPLAKHMPNAKLRLLLQETIEKGAWKLLWVPPSMPYYDQSGPFAELPDFSKVLVFSSWLLVPRMISTLVSYEAERLSVGNHRSVSEREEEKREYFDKRRHPRPQILYRLEKGGNSESLAQPVNIIYLYPSQFLAMVYDPQQNLVDNKSLKEIKAGLKLKFIDHLKSEQIQNFAKGDGDWKAWLWCAPLLLDKIIPGSDITTKWLVKGLPKSESVTDNSEDNSAYTSETTGKAGYFKRVSEFFQDPFSLSLPSLTKRQLEEVAEYLVTLTLASPSVCYLRTQQRQYTEITIEMMDAAFEVASGFVTTFNKPESIAIIRLCTSTKDGGSYLDRVMEYSISGNLQALLDEYFYLIREQEGLHSLEEIATHISDVLTIRSSSTKVDDASSILSSSLTEGEGRSKSIRTHFAVDFAGQKLQTAKTSGRQINIRQAFNSPFRPFVLATTSIGQEGLDFHLYCRKIFHWNLPANAIDIEQREGRINRYKGLVIRQNLVNKYHKLVKLTDKKTAWDEIFQIAEEREGKGQGICEMVPFWHTEPEDQIRIERFVPLYSFSRDIEKYKDLQRILAYYRITFGQPRQEELIMALADKVADKDYDAIKDLLIDLSPIRFYHS